MACLRISRFAVRMKGGPAAEALRGLQGLPEMLPGALGILAGAHLAGRLAALAGWGVRGRAARC